MKISHKHSSWSCAIAFWVTYKFSLKSVLRFQRFPCNYCNQARLLHSGWNYNVACRAIPFMVGSHWIRRLRSTEHTWVSSFMTCCSRRPARAARHKRRNQRALCAPLLTASMWTKPYSLSHFTTRTNLGCDVRKQAQYNPHMYYIHPVCIALKAYSAWTSELFPL